MGQMPGQPLPYLRAWREYRILTQGELGRKARVSPVTIARLESVKVRQKASVSMIGKLADALSITRAQLLDDAPPQRKPHAG